MAWLAGFAMLAAGVWLLVRDDPQRLERVGLAAQAAGLPVPFTPTLVPVFDGTGRGYIITPELELRQGDTIEWTMDGQCFDPKLNLRASVDQWNRPLAADYWKLPPGGGSARFELGEEHAGPRREFEMLADVFSRNPTVKITLRILRRADAPTVPPAGL